MVVRYSGEGGGVFGSTINFWLQCTRDPNVPISLQVMLVQPELHHLSLMTMYIIGYSTTLPLFRTATWLPCKCRLKFFLHILETEGTRPLVKVLSCLPSFCLPCRLAYRLHRLCLSPLLSHPLNFSEPNPVANLQRLPLSPSLSHPLNFSEQNPTANLQRLPLSPSLSHPLNFSEPNPTVNLQRLPLSPSLSCPLTFSEPNPTANLQGLPLSYSLSHPLHGYSAVVQGIANFCPSPTLVQSQIHHILPICI